MTEVLKFLGLLSSTLVILVPLIIWLIKRWIESEFSKNLEDYKHEINKSLEDYRHRINALFSRISKIHEKEFEVLPEAWRLLQIARGHVGSLTAPLQRHADLSSMDDARVKDFLNTMDPKFIPSDEEKLLKLPAHERNDFFKERLFWLKLNQANIATINFHNYILDNKIFLTTDLFEQFEKADKILSDCVLSREIDEQLREFSYDRYKKASEDLDVICGEIEELVQKRLHHEDAF